MKQVIFLNLDGFFSYSNCPYSIAIIAVFSGTCLFVSIQKKKKHWAGMLFSRLGKPAFHSFILLAILQKVGEEFKIHGTLSLVLTEAGSELYRVLIRVSQRMGVWQGFSSTN